APRRIRLWAAKPLWSQAPPAWRRARWCCGASEVRAVFIQDSQPLHPDYPLPDLDDPIMRPFWEGARAGKLMQQREHGAGIAHWPPKPMYWKGGGRLEWFEAGGRGEIYSYVIGYEPFLPAFRHLLPHIMVVVQLDEGPRL